MLPVVPHVAKELIQLTLKEEMKRAEDNGKDFIPPYKLNEIMKLASKIVKLLTENSTAVTMSYGDMATVMRIVEETIEKGYHE